MAHIAERIAELRRADRPQGATWDRGWYDAITAATTVARGVAAEPDPLRELAEWLVSLDHGGLLSEYPIVAQIIARAREALDKEG